MVLRHVMEHESSHLGRLIHPCSVVEGVVSPYGRQDWRNTHAVGAVTSGALCGIDCFAGDRIAIQCGNLDKPPARPGLSLNAVSREPVDVGDQCLHFGAVRRRGRTGFTAREALRDAVLERDHVTRPLIEHWEQSSKVYHRGSMSRRTALEVAIVAGELVSDIG